MRCVDSTFLIDLIQEDASALTKAKSIVDAGEGLSIAAPALTEILIGAHYKGGRTLRETLERIGSLDVLAIDAEVAGEAARIGAEMLRRGQAVGTIDLLIAAAAKLHGHILLTRDTGFSRIPGIAVETY